MIPWLPPAGVALAGAGAAVGDGAEKPCATNKKTADNREKSPASVTIQAKSASPKAASAKPKSSVLSSKLSYKPSHEEISLLAHRFFEQRGKQHGCHEQDWLQAEQALADRNQA